MLVSKMKLFGDNQTDLANAMNLSLASVNAKINGKSNWTQSEISFIKDRYNLTPEEVIEIFFNESVHQEGTVPRGT
jgi:plasmid maintenance system antidote protein VapI